MKKKQKPSKMHPAAKFVIKYGTIISLVLLCIACLMPRGTFYAISTCRSSVYSFAVSIIGGLFLDVIAQRMGMRE